MGWIDPDYAIEMFMDITGLSWRQQVDSMLAALADLDLLYYEDESVSNGKGEKSPIWRDYNERNATQGSNGFS
jgi:hypothetical protein